MPWRPSEPGEVPTLGYYAIDWAAELLNSPDDPDGAPLVFTREQEDFLLRWYAINPVTGRFKYHRGLIGRPRGWGKSPLLGAIAIIEGLADIVPAGWDADGRPVGQPWSAIRTPLVHIAAVSEDQTKNTWDSLLEMLGDTVIDAYPGLEPMATFVNFPVGKAEKIASSSKTVKGARPIFVSLDQTEVWVPSNGGKKLAQTLRTNAAKVGGRTLESPNAFTPGEESVAEESAAYAADIAAGRALNDGLLYDHREAPGDTDLTDRESIVAGLRFSYGDSSDDPRGCVLHDPPCPPGWAPIQGNADMFWDPANDVQQLRSDFLNQITHASDSWISRPDWMARYDPGLAVVPGDTVVLGFDGSRGRNRGNADATALVGCRVSDGFLFEVRVWEAPSGPANRDWLPPVHEVDAEVRRAFQTWRVVGFLADPSGWTGQVAAWEAEFGRRLKVKATGNAPIAAWPRGKDTRVVEHVKRFREAVVNGELSHDGGASLTRHVLNARRRQVSSGYLLFKKYPDSPEKIDAAYAAVMAWKARIDAVSLGVTQRAGSGGRTNGNRVGVVL